MEAGGTHPEKKRIKIRVLEVFLALAELPTLLSSKLRPLALSTRVLGWEASRPPSLRFFFADKKRRCDAPPCITQVNSKFPEILVQNHLR